MQLGMIGLGRMGANMVRRLLRDDHECVVYNRTITPVHQLAKEGAVPSESLEEFVGKLAQPRHVWIMVPTSVVDAVLEDLVPLLAEGDTIIDGGNSHYHDDIRRGKALETKGINYLDVGTSGGVFGLERGYCMMIGGQTESVRQLDSVFATLAPGIDAAPRTPGRGGNESHATSEHGYLHCGPHGAGHFVKMVHNGIEYGMMAAYAEGLNVLSHANAGKHERKADAETTPLSDPELYQYDFDLREVTEVWRRGSVIASWLLDLTAHAFLEDPKLEGFAGRVSDSGEGRWTLQAAIDESVPTPVLASALFARFTSRGEDDLANRVLSAMRGEFGGHKEKTAEEAARS
jgi:6-phosphogluconate dehydrogenase